MSLDKLVIFIFDNQNLKSIYCKHFMSSRQHIGHSSLARETWREICVSVADIFHIIGNSFEFPIIQKHSVQDATGAQMNMQANACAHQRAKSCCATLCSMQISAHPRGAFISVGDCNPDWDQFVITPTFASLRGRGLIRLRWNLCETSTLKVHALSLHISATFTLLLQMW